MSVGLYDMDMATYTLVPFNLEIMKLSAYYKNKGEIVVLAPSLTPERNTKFIIRKDYNDGYFPKELLQKNVEYGGLAFTNNHYAPLPLEIERMQPDTSIYYKMESLILGDGSKTRAKIYKNLAEGEHCRLSLDGKTIWRDFPYQFKNLYSARNILFHDYDLGAVEGSFETVKKILSKARTDGWATRVGMKFPIQISDGQSLLNWSSIRSNSTFYSLRYNGVIDNDYFMEWIKTCDQKTVYNQIEYNVTPTWYEENDFLTNKLPQIFRQIVFSRSYHTKFSLMYEEDFFSDKTWAKVLQLFNYYFHSLFGEKTSAYIQTINTDTLFDFASKSQDYPKSYYGEVFSKSDIRNLFAFVREKNYSLFKDFYECSVNTLGGKI